MSTKVKRKFFTLGINRRGINLSQAELDILLFLYEHRTLTAPQMYRILANKEPSMKFPTFRRRLSQKYIKYDVVAAEQYSLGQKGFNFNYYRISHTGLDILMSEGLLTEDKHRYQMKRLATMKHVDHYLTIQEVVTSIIAKGLEHDKPLRSIRPLEYLGNDQISSKDTVVPDWVIGYNDTYLMIELDMGTEQLSLVDEKILKYKQEALQNPDKTYKVLVVELDESMNLRFVPSNRERRVGNMKQKLMYSKALGVENLDVYVMPLYRAYELGYKLLMGDRPYTKAFIEGDMQHLLKNLNANSIFGFTLEPIMDEFVYIPSPNYPVRADMVCHLVNEAGHYIETIMFLFIEEGSVESMATLDLLNEYVKKGLTQVPIQRIIAIYENEEEMNGDIIGIDYKNVYFGNSASYGYTGQEPTFYRLVSPYRKEGRALLEWKY
ncbi:replication-relaxation family protein [Priestia koreensis]|uniref:replication-relaxation family protein n=1 Tax=Priestia koreensis TaxID=284581 RepID=UPI001F58842A|nr:replication-relaxation family protein [Priestia koreensis]UNL87455.1 replication-relaxation family protein [Priestia koreensis]